MKTLINALRHNAIACLALLLALGTGGAYAADKISGKQIAPNAIRSKHIKNNQVRSKDVKDASLLARDFAGGELPAGARGPKGDRGPQGPAGPAGADAGSTMRAVLSTSDPESVVASPAGLGEIRVDCNPNNGGSAYAYYRNTTGDAVDLWQDEVRDGSPDVRDMGKGTIDPGASGGFVNNASARHVTFGLGKGSGTSAIAATVIVDLAVDGGCFAQATTIGPSS